MTPNISQLIQNAGHIRPVEAQISALLEIVSALSDRILVLNHALDQSEERFERVDREMVKSEDRLSERIDRLQDKIHHINQSLP